MKQKTGVSILAFLAAIILFSSQPAPLVAGETGGGNFWDFLLDTKPSTGTKWTGPLSIYYAFLTGKNSLCLNSNGQPDPGNPKAWLYFTVRLSQGGYNYISFMKSATTYCYRDTAGVGTAARIFLNDVAIPSIYNTTRPWAWKAIENAIYDFDEVYGAGGAFVADIQISVK